MKLVINKCFGGFGLSREAFLRVVEIPDGAAYEIDEYDGRESVCAPRTWYA